MRRLLPCMLIPLLLAAILWLSNPLYHGSIICIVLDASGSMDWPLGNVSKIDAAKTAIRDVLPVLGDRDEAALVAFYTCGDIRVECPLTSNITEISIALEDIAPCGATPFGDALITSWETLNVSPSISYKQPVIILVTDGAETCVDPWYPVEAARACWLSSQEKLIIHTIYIGEEDSEILMEIANMTGGVYATVRSLEELEEALRYTLEAKGREVYLLLPGLLGLLCMLIRSASNMPLSDP